MEKRFNPNVPTIYVDGSYSEKCEKFSYGVYFTDNDYEFSLCESFGKSNPFYGFTNVAGELFGAIVAIQKAIELGYEEINLAYDFEGIGFFWHYNYQSDNDIAIAYKQVVRKLMKEIKVNFVKVKAHTNIEGNEMADTLAKAALYKELHKKAIA